MRTMKTIPAAVKTAALLLALLMIFMTALSCGRDGGETPAPAETADGTETPAAPNETETPEGPEEPEEFLPVLRFAVCSDIHINGPHDDESARFAKLFDTAYAYSESQAYTGLDAVIVVGDFATSGKAAQMEIYKSVVAEKCREGTVMIDVMGNHEFNQDDVTYLEVMGEPLHKHEVINGFHFIAVSPDKAGGTPDEKAKFYDEGVIQYMTDALVEAAAEDPAKPIFTFQHMPVLGTCYGSESGNDGAQAFQAVYEQYPQVVNFAGHTHAPINHVRAVWQGAYTAVATGTLYQFDLCESLTEQAPFRKQAGQYWIVEVDDDYRIRLLAYDILTEDFFETPSNTDEEGTKLIFDIACPSDPSTYVYTDARAETATAPRFPEGAEFSFQPVRNGRVNLTIPQALDDYGVVAYQMVLERPAEDGTFTKETSRFTSRFYLEPLAETVTTSLTDMQDGLTYRISVAPVNAYGIIGDAITTEYTPGE